MSSIINDPTTGLDAIEHGGETHVLACLPTHPQMRRRFMPITAMIPVIPRHEWKPVDMRPVFGDEHVLSQKNHGSCTGFASTGALMKCRAMSSSNHFVKLSGSFTYSYINGGRDQGASIGDTLDSLMVHGTCTDEECPWDKIYPRQIPDSARQSAQRFKVLEGYRVETFDEAVSAILIGNFTIVYAIMVGRTFDNLDAEGVVGYDPGAGNHAVHACGLYLSKRWGMCLDGWNSWDTTWGDRGRFRSAQKHWDGVSQDAYAVRVSSLDPNAPQPPVATD